MRKKKIISCKKITPNGNTLLWGFFLDKLLHNMNVSVMVADAEWNILFANKKYLTFFKCSSKDISGKSWIDNVVPEANRRDVRKIFRKVRNKKSLSLIDTPVVPYRGRKRNIQFICIPLQEKNTVSYMFIGSRSRYRPKNGVRFCAENTSEDISKARREAVNALFAASKKSEPHTAKHAVRVMSIAVILARKIGISRERIEKLEIASLLHDLGKLVIDEKILFKKGKLNKREYEKIKEHSHMGAEIVKIVCFLHDILPIMANHHENYDGTGYPKGLCGREIPIEARILSIADIYEALTADRPYRKAFREKAALTIIKGERGRKLDPEITDIFLHMARGGRFKKVKR